MMFTSPDTLIPDQYNPLDWNRYAYARYNPVKYTDPTGHWVETAFDVISLGMTINDIRNEGFTVMNTVSLVTDVASVVLPIVPAGVSHAIRAAKVADKVLDTVDTATDIYRAADNIQDTINTTSKAENVLDIGAQQASTLYHYTNEKGLNGILDSNELQPSLKSVNPRDARYGDGQYLTDIVPGSMTPSQLSRQLVNNPFHGEKFTHYVEINVDGLNVIQGRPSVYVIPNTKPLNLTDRIVSYGAVRAK